MTREQFICLRPGQKVRVTHFPNRYLAITAVRITRGTRILELEGGLWVAADQVTDVLPTKRAA